MFRLFNHIILSLCLVIAMLSQTGCAKNEPLSPSLPEEDDSLLFETFTFEKRNNPFLKDDVVFDIQNNTISGELKHYFYNAIPSFTTTAQTVEINELKQVSGSSIVDFSKGVSYSLKSATGTSKTYTVKVTWDDRLPQVSITTDGQVSINSKQVYTSTKIDIDGQQKYSDYTGTAKIRGRGNSTWTYPKKPYKIKLDSDSEILGLAAEKDWILLANYLDGTHLLNAVGMKIGQLLDMPFTNTIIPVEVELNGKFLGIFGLTEQIEVKKNRINIGDDGLLLSLDTNFDEPWQFQSAAFQLPVTIKYPKEMDAPRLQSIREEFEVLEALIADTSFPDNNYLEYFDGNSLANYLIVYMLTNNEEINHPKSSYLYKTNEGKFTMGPIWDFDWGFSFEGTQVHFSSFACPLFWSPPRKGTRFFSKLLDDPKIRSLLKKNWASFQANNRSTLYSYIDEYAFFIEGARARDFGIWKRGKSDFDEEVASLKEWLTSQENYMNEFIGNL